MTEVVGAVLAGGASRRMGRDKAVMDVGGRLLVERAVGVLGACVDRVVLLGGSTEAVECAQRLGVDVVPDRCPGEGPLVAVVDAVEAVGDLVVVAVDMVGVDPAMVAAVIAAGAGVDVAVASSAGRRQPAFARWNSSVCGTARAMVDAGDRSLVGVLDRDDVAVVEVPVGDGAGVNLNSPDDVAAFMAAHHDG